MYAILRPTKFIGIIVFVLWLWLDHWKLRNGKSIWLCHVCLCNPCVYVYTIHRNKYRKIFGLVAIFYCSSLIIPRPSAKLFPSYRCNKIVEMRFYESHKLWIKKPDNRIKLNVKIILMRHTVTEISGSYVSIGIDIIIVYISVFD